MTAEARGLYVPVVRLVVQLIVLGIINWIFTELPMLKAISIPGFPLTIPAIISGIIGIIMIMIFLNFRRDFIPILRGSYTAFPQASTIASSAIMLGIIIVAYSMFEGLIKPFMAQFSWAYAVIFLLIALWPLYSLITTLYRSSRPVADWVSSKIAEDIAEDKGEVIRCQSCGKVNPTYARFCSGCGSSLMQTTIRSIKCTRCGKFNKSADKYCLNCGAPVEEEETYELTVD